MQHSQDGWLRLTLDDVLSVQMTHLISGIDFEPYWVAQDCGTRTTISGYTEWVSDGPPKISVGWDWIVELAYGGARWKRVGLPRTNVMLIESRSRGDYGLTRNMASLATVVDAMAWQESAQAAIEVRYI